MALFHPPRVGAVILCMFPDELAAPEMIKTRPVVVVSPRITGRHDLATIVPLSTKEPAPFLSHHCEIPIRLMPKSLQSEATRVWAKCDMLYTFSLERFDRFKAGRDRATGKRLYEVGQLELVQIIEIRRCIAAGLGITPDVLTP
jgi:uncharacterized protein YifN (PemK superfamily)